MTKYWVGVVSKEHVERGISGNFIQVCHGKQAALKRMKGDDWFVYYSPTNAFQGKDKLRCFTAACKILPNDPYQFQMFPDFIPWRRDVQYVSAQQTPIEPLVSQLSFSKDNKHWGMILRRGCFEITQEDFMLIAEKMSLKDI